MRSRPRTTVPSYCVGATSNDQDEHDNPDSAVPMAACGREGKCGRPEITQIQLPSQLTYVVAAIVLGCGNSIIRPTRWMDRYKGGQDDVVPTRLRS
jgi:hypothetical protein